MPKLTLKKPKDEKELHHFIQQEFDALEEGLELLGHEYVMKKGRLDFLCVDSGGRLVVIEVKVGEDPDVLFQALKYYMEIEMNKYVIADSFSEKKIDPKSEPRIILIAERFSDDIRKAANLIIPDVELYEYVILNTPSDNEGIYYRQVSLPKIESEALEPPKIDKLRNYLTKEDLQPIFDDIIQQIKDLDNEIEAYPTMDYVGFKYRNRQFVWLQPYRKKLALGVHIFDETTGRVSEYKELCRLSQKGEDYTQAIAEIDQSFQLLKQLRQ